MILLQSGFEEEDVLRHELKRVTQTNDELKAMNKKLAEQYQEAKTQLTVSREWCSRVGTSIIKFHA